MNKKIAIIGGGITGLVAALELARKGYSITIIEKGNDIGGLASGFRISGNTIEKAYHHIFVSDNFTIELIGKLGLESKLKWYKSTMGIYYHGKTYPFSSPINLLMFWPISFLSRIRTAISTLLLTRDKYWRKLITKKAYDYMLSSFGSESYKVIWEPLLIGKFGERYKKISMAWLWSRLYIRAKSKSLLHGERLGYIDGGFDTLIAALEKELINRSVEIRKSTSVESIISIGENIVVKSQNVSESFDKVIATAPAPVFRELVKTNIDQIYSEKLSRIEYIGAICLVFSSTTDLTHYYWNNINDTDSPFQVFINHTALVGTESYNGDYVYYIGKYLPHSHRYFITDEDTIKQEWYEFLSKVSPKFNSEDIKEAKLFKFKYAQHIVDTDYENKILSSRTPLENVYLVNFSQIFPEDRGVNYAIEQGKVIAKEIAT